MKIHEFNGKNTIEYYGTMDSIDVKRFSWLVVVNGAVVVLALGLYVVFLNNVFPLLDLSGLLRIEAGIVAGVQRLFMIPVSVQDLTLNYFPPSGNNFSIELIPECAGVVEMLIFVIMILVFRGVGREAKIRGILIFLPVIFFENIARLAVLYPMSQWFGVDTMWSLHSFIWHYGQLLILLGLFGIWYLKFASQEISGHLTKGHSVARSSSKRSKRGKKAR
jgi:exosortase/archaeosortase family protein